MARRPEPSVIRSATLLSLVCHALLLWILLTRLIPPKPDETAQGAARPALLARLAPRPAPTPAAPPAPPVSSARITAPRMVRRPPAAPPVAEPAPAPAVSTAPPPAPAVIPPDPMLATAPPVMMTPTSPLTALPPAAAPPMRPPPPAADLSTYIEMQRRAMGDPILNAGRDRPPSLSSTEIDNQRRDRIIAGNLAAGQPSAFGYDPKAGGGVFQIKRLGSDDAEFWFAGFNKDFGRKVKQLIEVRKGNSVDIRVAVVRKMIEIIRDEVQGDFSWQSHRLGRDISMSARPADDQGLQEFLMLEMFSDSAPAPRR